MLKPEANHGGTPTEAFDQIRAVVLNNRSQFWKELSLPFYDFNRPDMKISDFESIRSQPYRVDAVY